MSLIMKSVTICPITFLPGGGFALVMPENPVRVVEQEKRTIKVTINPSLMGYVIGKEGVYFNAITKCSKTHFIWYNKERNEIDIYGPPKNLQDAEDRLIQRMNHIEQKDIYIKNLKANANATFGGQKWADVEED